MLTGTKVLARARTTFVGTRGPKGVYATSTARWSPDGQWILFGGLAQTGDPHSDFAQPTPEQPVNIVTVRPDGSDLTYLTNFADPRHRAYVGTYSPDGQWLIFRLENREQNALHRIRPDGTDLHRITDLSSFRPRNLDWGPKPERCRCCNLWGDRGETAYAGSPAGSTRPSR